MIVPIWFRSGLRDLWSVLTFKYVLIASLCLWGIWIQMQYRVPGRFLFLLLPWIGVALSALSFILLFHHVIRWIPANDVFRQVFRRIEWWANLLIRIFVYYSLLVYANAKLDQSLPVDQASEVLEIAGGEIDLGINIPLSWVELRSWRQPQRTERLLLQGEEKLRLWPGQPVVVQVRQGYFRLPWVFKLERDEEKYSREILEVAPTASEAWKNLVNFYLDHQRWKEASMAAQDYMKIYPDDYDFALSVASVFGQAGHNAEAVALLEPFVSRRRDYVLYNVVGFALSKLGKKAQAIELLEASIPLDPNSWWAYYHLGYVYRSMGKSAEAVAMFEKVLQRRPNYPEIEEQLRVLRPNVSPQRSSRRPESTRLLGSR